MTEQPDPRYPVFSVAARSLGAQPASSGSLEGTLAALAADGPLSIVAVPPLDHYLDFMSVRSLLRTLRELKPGRTTELFVRTQTRERSLLRELPAHRVSIVPLGSDLTARVAAARQLLRAVRRDTIFIGTPPRWLEQARRWPFRAGGEGIALRRGPWAATTAEDAGVGLRWFRVLESESPSWRVASGQGTPPAPRRLLLHQARFHLGDTLWLTAVLRVIAQQEPGCEVTVVASESTAEAARRLPFVRQVLVYDPAQSTNERARQAIFDAGGRFDVALFAFGRARSSRWLVDALRQMGVAVRVNLEFRQHVLEPPGSPAPFTHEGWCFWGAMPSARMLLHLIEPLWPGMAQSDSVGLKPALRLDGDDHEAANRWLRSRGFDRRSFAVLAPGGVASEPWPEENFASLARHLVQARRLGVAVAGTGGETALLGRVVDRARVGLDGATETRLVALQEPLATFAAVVGKAEFLVANDSGSIHVAEALDVPTLYFSPWQNLVHSHPIGTRSWAVFDDVENRLANISVEQAISALEEMQRREGPTTERRRA